MMSEPVNLYFIAIVPPSEICEEITKIRQNFADRFYSKYALKVIPHITLKAPFKFPAKFHSLLSQWFGQTPVIIKPFQQELKNFGCFANRNKPVIFIQPVMNESLLFLHNHVIDHFIKAFPEDPLMNLELKYNPHITVAYRDLLPEQFKLAWKEYRLKEYAATFEVNSFHLLQHNVKQWNSILKFTLQ